MYSFTGIGRQQKRGGGLGIVHKTELSFTSQISVENSFEHHTAQCKHLTVPAVFRPPPSFIPVFLDQFEELTAMLECATGRVDITGDFNLTPTGFVVNM